MLIEHLFLILSQFSYCSYCYFVVEKSPIPIDKYTSHLSSFSPTTTRAPLAHSYWAINHVSYLLGESGEEGLELRYDHWESHLAWSRRTHFARHIPQDMEVKGMICFLADCCMYACIRAAVVSSNTGRVVQYAIGGIAAESILYSLFVNGKSF